MKALIFLSLCAFIVASTQIRSNAADLGRPPTSMPCIIGNCSPSGVGYQIECKDVSDKDYSYGIHCVNPPPGFYCKQDTSSIECQCLFRCSE
uniref:Secreted protein n=1 Tax=Panagrolaimus sp. PS1159 TaxID=55785 RepID=A0AC35GVU7_9BILA